MYIVATSKAEIRKKRVTFQGILEKKEKRVEKAEKLRSMLFGRRVSASFRSQRLTLFCGI